MYRRTVERTQPYSLFLRSVLASDYFRCYVKYTSNILNFTLLNFKFQGAGYKPRNSSTKNKQIINTGEKTFSMKEELPARNKTFYITTFSLRRAQLPMVSLDLICMKVSYQEQNTLFLIQLK